MTKVAANGIELAYLERGSGNPVVLVHGSVLASYYWGPMLNTGALSAYRVITYDRRGYQGSSRQAEPCAIADEVEDLKGLLDALGLQRVHLVGHSWGGLLGLTLALKYPQIVHTLTLLEPAMVLLVPSAGQFAPQVGRMEEIWQAEGPEAAIDFFLRLVAGDIRDGLPDGWWERMVSDADGFALEGADFPQWRPTKEQVSELKMPVLAVLGEQSHNVTPAFDEVHALLKDWLPEAEEYVLPGATHALHVMNPRDLATAISAFLSRHPMSV